jgi:hypothetical protein
MCHGFVHRKRSRSGLSVESIHQIISVVIILTITSPAESLILVVDERDLPERKDSELAAARVGRPWGFLCGGQWRRRIGGYIMIKKLGRPIDNRRAYTEQFIIKKQLLGL